MKTTSFERGLIIVILAALLAGSVIFVSRIVAADAFSKEEAQHGLYAFWISQDLKTFDLHAFWYDTSRQMAWPFLHSWLLGVFFWVFGASYITARLFSLIVFVCSVFLMYLLTMHYCEKAGNKPAIAAALLALCSPLLIRFATLNMLEGLGALLFLAAAYIYMICEEHAITLEYVILAFLIGISLYTNYIVAYVMVVAFMLATLFKVGPLSVNAYKLQKKGEGAALGFIWWAYRKLIVLFVLLSLVGLWFSFNFGRKILIFSNMLFKYSTGEKLYGLLPNLLYYPQAIIQQVTFSPWLGLLALISLFLPFIANRYWGLKTLFIFVWTGLILLTLTVPTKSAQLMYMFTPFIIIIFTCAVFYFKEKIKQYNPKLVNVFLAILILPALFSMPNLLAVWFPSQPASNMRQVLDYFDSAVPKGAAIVIPLNLQHLNPEVIEFHLQGRAGEIVTDTGMSSPGQERYLMTIELDPQSPYMADIIDDSLFRWNLDLREKLMRGEIRLYSTRSFADVGLTARVFAEQAPMANY